MTRHTFIGAEVSYYSGKVRAYLRYKDIPFDEVSATREVYRDVIIPRTGVRFIPVLISADDVAIQDSTAIIDFLEQHHPTPSIYPSTPLQRLLALLLEVYCDEWLIIPAMHYRWNVPENREFAIREFGRLSAPAASSEEQRAIGEKLSGPFAGALPHLGVSATTREAIEASYRVLLQDFDTHLESQPFLFGTRPSIGDFSLFGPLYAHLYRDPYSGRLMKQHAPRVAQWVERMNQPQPCSGDFLAADDIPASLEPLLRRMFAEQGPVLANTLASIEAWAAAHEDPALPRSIGRHAFSLGESSGERSINPFTIWRWQRPYDHYHALTGIERRRADALLERVGGLETLHVPIRRRLQRMNNHLFLA